MLPRLLLLGIFTVAASAASAQSSSFNAPALADVRRAAQLVPGDLPTAVNLVRLNPFQAPMNYVLEGGTSERVDAAYPVFQIRFPRGWITVDAALDRQCMPDSRTFVDAQYDSIQHALREARLVVVTHEHHDHAVGIVRSPFLEQIRSHTLLTRPQLTWLREHPNHPTKLDSTSAGTYLVVDYDPLMPIAPGVVLIKTPGHTPGSQSVYVRLKSGQELLLAGDVAWNMAGIATLQHKPESSTRGFGGEDRSAISRELKWLQGLGSNGVYVLVSHDEARIKELLPRGILQSGYDFSVP